MKRAPSDSTDSGIEKGEEVRLGMTYFMRGLGNVLLFIDGLCSVAGLNECGLDLAGHRLIRT